MGLWQRIAELLRGGDAPAGSEPREPARPEPPADLAAVLADLRRAVADLSDDQLAPEEVDPHASLLEEAVIDSVAGVQLLTFVEERYGVVIDEVELAGGIKTLDEMARRVLELGGSAS